MTTELKDRIEEIANDNQWSVSFSTQNNEEWIEFEGCTPAGQDLIVNVWDTEFESLSDVEDALYAYAEEFDECEEAYKWLGSDGHGINGAPYHMGDVLEDMVSAKQMIYALSDTMKE